MSNQKQQKPTLTGQRFKTRKRGLSFLFKSCHFCAFSELEFSFFVVLLMLTNLSHLSSPPGVMLLMLQLQLYQVTFKR